ncbi:UNVERIFIED_CONTAM: Nicastrin [Sesamum radiatum]|uniref:Nicastrin n=1 Tax=Sesamum radiatum TaxID=300843 RepID=A0AAW2VQY9_SESRA
MDFKLSLLLSSLCFVALLRLSLSASGETKSFESVPDLEKSMYKEIEGFPCVRLLNLSGEIGCSNPGREKVVAPIVRFQNAKEFVGSAAILVSIDDFESLLSRHVFLQMLKFPQAEFAPYQSNNFEWNPDGSGIMWKAYNFPVFLLSQTSTSILQEAALMNEKSKKSYTENVAEFDLVMQDIQSGLGSILTAILFFYCRAHYLSALKAMTCWRTLLSLQLLGQCLVSTSTVNISSSLKAKPIILAMTSMDSASFFRDKSLGAESPISGLIALLAVVDALSHLDGLEELNKQLVFVVLTGESWGYLGSRRFFLESDKQSDTIKGLDLAMLETVIEIGSVGKSFSQGNKTFFAHTAGLTSSVNGTFNVLQHAQDSLVTESIFVKRASTTNPGVPPSSLMTFLRKNPLENRGTLDDYYHGSKYKPFIHCSSCFPCCSNSIILAGGKDSAINTIKVNASLVEELLGCLLACEPGLSCGLVKQYISPSTTCPSHYVGVILGEPSSALYPAYAGDVSRFVWNFLADKTSVSSRNVGSSCAKACSGVGELCIRGEADGKGVCVTSTTRYHRLMSTVA